MRHSDDFGAETPVDRSFADVIEAIAADDTTLSPEQKRGRPTSLRKFAGYLGRPPECVPASIPAIAPAINKLHPETVDANPKTFRNHRSNVQSALRWFNKHVGARAPMAEHYRVAWERIDKRFSKELLSPYLRFLSAQQIDPAEVSDAHLEAYLAHRKRTSFARIKPGLARMIAREWNACVDTVPGWPSQRLTMPAKGKRSGGPANDEFPEGLRADIEAFCEGLKKPRKAHNGRALRPNSKSTIARRRRELEAAVRAAVQAGIPLDELQSLRDLLRPDRVRRVLDYYWEKKGKPSKDRIIPSLYTIDLAGALLSLARQIGGVSEEELDELDQLRACLEAYRRYHKTMTRKNRDVVMQAVQDEVWRKVVQLPGQLMERARVQRAHAPYRAAVTSQLAITIRILLRAPVRIANLAAIRLDQHLFRRGGNNGCYHLHFDGHEVKNGEELDFELDARTTAMIDEHFRLHRPRLMRGLQHDWLFPSGDPDRPKTTKDLSQQVSKRLWDELGLKITPHQFRHAAGAIMLKADPGNLEWVRRVLGHTSTRTTARFYAFLDGLEASRRYGAILSDLEGRDGHA